MIPVKTGVIVQIRETIKQNIKHTHTHTHNQYSDIKTNMLWMEILDHNIIV